jgi:hypothetical protein
MPIDYCHEDVDPEKGTSELVLPSDLRAPSTPESACSSVTDVNDYTLGRADTVTLSRANTLTLSRTTTFVGSENGHEKKGDLEVPPPVPPKPKLVGTTDHLKSKPGQFKVTWERASRWVQFQLWFNTYRFVTSILFRNVHPYT